MKRKGFFICLIWLFSLQAFCFSKEAKRVLVFGGKTGWIGQKIVGYLKEGNHNVFVAESRLENRTDLLNEIAHVSPDYIINCAGVTGTPNVDWCETHQLETLRTNIIGTMNLIDVAALKNIHITNFSTGCIFEYDDKHPMNSGIGFTEEDQPNFDGSFYSKTKGLLESLILYYPNLLNLRVRMPISADLHPKNFITKIARYEKVINIPNSMTILDDLLPIAIDMTFREMKGNFNFVNPGTLSHNEVLDLYKCYIDPSFTYKNFTIEEQDKILKSRRSNNELSAEKLLRFYPNIPHAKDSLHQVFKKMSAGGMLPK